MSNLHFEAARDGQTHRFERKVRHERRLYHLVQLVSPQNPPHSEKLHQDKFSGKSQIAKILYWNRGTCLTVLCFNILEQAPQTPLFRCGNFAISGQIMRESYCFRFITWLWRQKFRLSLFWLLWNFNRNKSQGQVCNNSVLLAI